MSNEEKKERKRQLVLQASDLVIDYEKLKKDKESLPSLKSVVLKYINAELWNIKKQLEELENEEG